MRKISEFHKRLLFELDNNSRQSFSKIAKKLKTSPQRILYATNKLASSGIITSFMTTISTMSTKTKYVVKMYIQFTGITEENENLIYTYLQQQKEINWIAKTLGYYDLFIALMISDLEELAEFKMKFFKNYGKYVNNYDISFIQKAYTFKRSYLINKNPELFPYSRIHKKIESTINKTDEKILKIIVDNSRLGILDISKQLGIDTKTVIKRIRDMEKVGIIQGYRINIDRQKLGLRYFKVFIKLRSYEESQLKKLYLYLMTQKYMIHLIENIGKYELELEVEIPSSEELQIMNKNIRNTFPEEIDEINSTEILNEIKLTWLPQ